MKPTQSTLDQLTSSSLREFDEEFTIVVHYKKWPDEREAQKLREPIYRLRDFPNTNPKTIKRFLSHHLSIAYQAGVEEGRNKYKTMPSSSVLKSSSVAPSSSIRPPQEERKEKDG